MVPTPSATSSDSRTHPCPHHAVRPLSRLPGCPDSGGPATRSRRSGRAPTTPSGRPGRRSRRTSRCGRPRPPRRTSAWSTRTAPRCGTGSPSASLGIWHGAVPGVEVGPALRLPRRRALGARAGAAVQPAEAAARPVRPGGQRRARAGPGDLRLHGRALPRPATCSTPAGKVPLSVVVDDRFDWQGDAPLRRRWRDTVIYELHVKGMTQLHDRVPEQLRGTYAGLATPAVTDYLRDLGVTAVELLPVHQFVHRAGGRRARADQLLGLQLDRLLRPARGVLLLRRPRRAGHRVQGRWSRPSTTPGSR